MKGMPLYSFLFLLFLSLEGFCQINYSVIEKKITDSQSDAYYPTLLQRFLDSDSTLTIEDFQLLYYGAVFHKNYDNNKIMDAERQIRLANYAGEFLEAYNTADSLLQEYPMSVQAYFEKAYACFNLKRFEEEAYNSKRYKVLIRTILSSGDGKTFESAYYANTPNDEYETLKYLRVESKEEAELEYNGNSYDLFTLKPNKSKLKHLYFNISKQGRTE
jgi:hypothetical protein